MLGGTILISIFLCLTTFSSFQGFYGAEARKTLQSDISNGTEACVTGNYIDDCWRCSDSLWENKRKRLADCAYGFGKKAKGGKKGDFYTVTSNSDDPVNPRPGTLRYAVIQEHPLWITFEGNMVIDLKAELVVNSHKTIDGRGADVHIIGYGCIILQYVGHVIVHGIHIHDCKPAPSGTIMVRPGVVTARGGTDGDGISLFGARDVWIDHCSLWSCSDGLIDVIVNSTHVTISNNHFRQHDKVMLLGYNDDDASEEKILRVTIAYNYFGQDLGQRMPRCRHGRFHIVNNFYNHWLSYAIGGTANPSILSQGNIYIASDEQTKKEVTSRIDAQDWANWNWLSYDDELVNGAVFTQSGSTDIESYKLMFSMEARPSSEVMQITADAGVLQCDSGMPCVHSSSAM